jgi:Lrp/AsnC family transcriptional regulator for asnA, asnC and gidA
MEGPSGSGRTAGGEPVAHQLDTLDRAIISQLQIDGRRPFAAIARAVGVTEGTVRFRVARLQDEDILHIVAFANPFPLGYAMQASVLLRTMPAVHDSVAETVASWPEVMYVSSCVGSADLYMHIICKDHDEMWRLLGERLGSVDGVLGTETLMELHVHKTRYVYPGLTESLTELDEE